MTNQKTQISVRQIKHIFKITGQIKAGTTHQHKGIQYQFKVDHQDKKNVNIIRISDSKVVGFFRL